MSTLTEDLTAKLIKLAVLREESTRRNEKLAAQRRGFEITIADEAQAAEGVKRSIEAVESEIRALGLIVHEQTGNKKPTPALDIVELTDYQIDEPTVIAHAKAHADVLGGLVKESLNVAAVKKMVGAGVSIPGVTVRPLYGTRIASDIAKAMGSLMQEAA